MQNWRWILVEDRDKKAALGDIYRDMAGSYLTQQSEVSKQAGDKQTHRVMESAVYLAENLEKAPVLAIPCLQGRPEEGTPIMGIMGMAASIFPAVWSFQLALRARGLGSCLTSLHLLHENEAAKLLGIPDDVIQVALLPVAYTKGTDFKPAKRPEPSTIMHWNQWEG